MQKKIESLFSWLDGKQMDVFCMLKRQVYFVMTQFSGKTFEALNILSFLGSLNSFKGFFEEKDESLFRT